MNAQPWYQFEIKLYPETKNVSLGWYEYPFATAEIPSVLITRPVLEFASKASYWTAGYDSIRVTWNKGEMSIMADVFRQEGDQWAGTVFIPADGLPGTSLANGFYGKVTSKFSLPIMVPNRTFRLFTQNTRSRPWFMFDLTLSESGRIASLVLFSYPFFGAGIVPLPLTDSSLQRSESIYYNFGSRSDILNLSWGGDGDAAYATLRRKPDGSYKGSISFPNGGPGGTTFPDGKSFRVGTTPPPSPRGN